MREWPKTEGDKGEVHADIRGRIFWQDEWQGQKTGTEGVRKVTGYFKSLFRT